MATATVYDVALGILPSRTLGRDLRTEAGLYQAVDRLYERPAPTRAPWSGGRR